MPWNGNGVFQRNYSWTNDAASGGPNVTLSASRFDADDNDIAAGISNCMARDGQTLPLADIPWGNRKIINLGNPANAQDAATKAYVDNLRFGRSINVKTDFLAVGDGVTDDTAACQAAMAYAATLTPTPAVYFPRGSYLVSTSLTTSRAMAIYGDGSDQTQIIVASNIDALYIPIALSSDRGMRIAHLGIKQTLPYASVTGGAGIRMSGAYCSTIDDVRVTGFWNSFDIVQCPLSDFSGIKTESFKNYGAWFHGGYGYDIRVNGFTIGGNNGTNPQGLQCIRMEDMCDEFIFANGVCSTADLPLWTDASAYGVNTRPEFCRFDNVSFDSCSGGPDLSHCTDMIFRDSFFGCRPYDGIDIGVRGTTENILLEGCTFFNCGQSAVVIGQYAIDTDIIANRFISNSTSGANNFDTIIAKAGCGAFAVRDSRFRMGWGVTSTPRNHVRVEATGSANYSITDNDFADAGSANILDLRQGAGRVIRGNIGFASISRGVAAFAAGGTLASFAHGLGEAPSVVTGVKWQINGYPTAGENFRVISTDTTNVNFDCSTAVAAARTLVVEAVLMGN